MRPPLEPRWSAGGADAERDDRRRHLLDHAIAALSPTTTRCHRGECPHALHARSRLRRRPAQRLATRPPLHSMPVHRVQYGKVLVLQVPATLEPRGLLLGDEDGRTFPIVGGALGAGAAVSAVCIRAEAVVWPRYTLKVWASGPAPAPNRKGKADAVMAEIEVTSSTARGAVAVEELAYLCWGTSQGKQKFSCAHEDLSW
ncbi:hypothetical protein ZWY2020_038197 [Hordeum vulgare]|nr:hypothetical protein ZWY2020_038197 [Hordeum vulgare]